MALTTTAKYTFSDHALKEHQAHFEVISLHLDTYCIAFKNEVTDRYKIFWVEDGSGSYSVDDIEFSIEGSGVFCLSPGQIFSVRSEKIKSAYQISFDKDFYCVESHGKEIACNGLLFNNVHRATVVNVPSAEVVMFQGLVNQMITELESKGSAHQVMLETFLRMFLIQTLRLQEKQESATSSAVTHQQDPLVQEFIALVDKNFKEEHTVAGYAEKLFIAPKSLSKKLNALGYPTPLKVIKNRIILEAKRELKYTDNSVKEIAFELGFDDPGYFTRLFGKAVGLSPAKYRTN